MHLEYIIVSSILAFRLAVILGMLMAGTWPLPVGLKVNQAEANLVCTWILRGNGGLLFAIRPWTVFACRPQVGLLLKSNSIVCHCETFRNYFISLSLILSHTDVPPTESTSFPGVCPEETKEEYRPSYSWTPFKGHCYLFVTDEIEWADAASSCARHGKFRANWIHT